MNLLLLLAPVVQKMDSAIHWINHYPCHVQHFMTGKNFSFNQCHKQRFLLFFSWEIYFIKATENLFTVYA